MFSVANLTTSARMSFALRGLPSARRCSELSYFFAESRRNHFRIVSGRTTWQYASRSSGVRALPLTARRCRCSAVNTVRVVPVATASAALRTRTSSWRYSTRRPMRSLIAYASIATMNWRVTGSIEGPGECPGAALSSSLFHGPDSWEDRAQMLFRTLRDRRAPEAASFRGDPPLGSDRASVIEATIAEKRRFDGVALQTLFP